MSKIEWFMLDYFWL